MNRHERRAEAATTRTDEKRANPPTGPVWPHVALIVGTPAKGGMSAGYVSSILQLQGSAGRMVDNFGWINSPARTCPEARSDIVRNVIDLGEAATHLLFVDADIRFDPKVVWDMMALDVPVVGCTYAGRGSDGHTKIQLVLRRLEGEENVLPDDRKCIRVRFLGLGLTLIKVEVLRQMEEHYVAELGHKDAHQGRMLVDLFHEVIVNGELIGEDVAFFDRYRAMNPKNEVLCYLDAEVTHTLDQPMTIRGLDLIGHCDKTPMEETTP